MVDLFFSHNIIFNTIARNSPRTIFPFCEIFFERFSVGVRILIFGFDFYAFIAKLLRRDDFKDEQKPHLV
jgi:hypothetical protein